MNAPLVSVACIYALMALSVYLPFTAGDMSVFPIASMAISAYTFGIWTQHNHVSLLAIGAALGLGTLCAAGAGLVMLRLSGWGSALVSFALVIMVQTFFVNYKRGGGVAGLFGVPDTTLGPWILITTILCVTAVLMVEVLSTGRRLRALKADRLAAECAGIRTDRLRLGLFAASGLIAGLAGIFQAGFLGYISPDLFGISNIGAPLTAVFLGGSTIALGAAVGGVITAVGPYYLSWLQSYTLFAYSLVLILIILVRREGLLTRQGVVRVVRLGRRVAGHQPRGMARRASPPDFGSRSPHLRTRDPRAVQDGYAGRAAAVEAKDVSVSFDGLQVLDRVNLSVMRGETLGLVGPNGAGKTTLLNVVSGVLSPNHGQILMNGNAVKARRPSDMVRKGMTRTFQNLRMFGSLDVADNVLAAVGPDAEYWMDTLELRGKRNARAKSLPYGTQRRVEFARALATRPSVLLLDEPTAGMTPEESRSIEALLRDLKLRGTTIIVIEHNLGFVKRVCDRVVVLDAGRVLLSGSFEDISSDPAVIEAYLGISTSASTTTDLTTER